MCLRALASAIQEHAANLSDRTPTTMSVEIREESASALKSYGTIPIAFNVGSRLRVEPVDAGLGGLRLVEERVDPPWIKDYDAEHDEGPARWARRWDISNWGVLWWTEAPADAPAAQQPPRQKCGRSGGASRLRAGTAGRRSGRSA